MNSKLMAGDELEIDGILTVHGLPKCSAKRATAAKSPNIFLGQGHVA